MVENRRIVIFDSQVSFARSLACDLAGFGWASLTSCDFETLSQQICDFKPEIALLEPCAVPPANQSVALHLKSTYGSVTPPLIANAISVDALIEVQLGQAGFDGYVLKNSPIPNILRALNQFSLDRSRYGP